MADRQTLQFLEIPRQDPDKLTRGGAHQGISRNLFAIQRRDGRVHRPGAAFPAAILSANGNARCTITFRIGWRWCNDGKLFEAAELSHQTNSLPEMCGRICPQDRLCEGACTLNDGLGAVSIGAIEKYITDEAFKQGWKPDMSQCGAHRQARRRRGRGPRGAGLRRCSGAQRREAGGVRPLFEDRRIADLRHSAVQAGKGRGREAPRDHGVHGRRIPTERRGRPRHLPSSRSTDEFDAVFLGMGTYTYVKGRLRRRGSAGSARGAALSDFEHQSRTGDRRWNAGFIDMRGKQVVVLGGGDTGMDCNRTAIRQGASSVTCTYRRDEDNMPGSRRDYKNSKEEGVTFPVQQAADRNRRLRSRAGREAGGDPPGAAGAARPARAGSGAGDGRNHRRRCRDRRVRLPAESPRLVLEASGSHLHANGRVRVSRGAALPFQTTNPKVFAGGDMVRGSDLVVTAVFEGREAAQGILRYLAHTRTPP